MTSQTDRANPPGPSSVFVRTSDRATAISVRGLLTFIVLTFGWTWSLWAIATVIKPGLPGLSTAVFLAAGFGPSLAAVFVLLIFTGRTGLLNWYRHCLIPTVIKNDAWYSLFSAQTPHGSSHRLWRAVALAKRDESTLSRLGITWRLRPRWYVMVFLGPPVAMILALCIDRALGGIAPAMPSSGAIATITAQFGLVLVLGGPLGEEFGWRGCLLPGLTARLGWRWSSLIVGAVWGLWHVPLFYIPGTGQSGMPMALFLTSAIALTILFGRLAMNTAFSVIPALLLHWSINAWSLVIPIVPKGGSVRPYVLVMAILFVVAAIAFLKPGPKRPNCQARTGAG